MTQARVHTWSAHELLTAAALNAEFDTLLTLLNGGTSGQVLAKGPVWATPASIGAIPILGFAAYSGSISTTSSTYADMTNMTYTWTAASGESTFIIFEIAEVAIYPNGWAMFKILYDTSTQLYETLIQPNSGSQTVYPLVMSACFSPTAGSHTVKVQWKANGTVQVASPLIRKFTVLRVFT